jgi:5-methylthioribose kinase
MMTANRATADKALRRSPGSPSAYQPLSPETLATRLGHLREINALLGDYRQWLTREVGDGNLNLVFIVEGPKGSVVIKQALPYARVVGESWPMSLDRTYFEYHALTRLGARDRGRMPKVHWFDKTQAIIVMEHLKPHVILRKSLMAGAALPSVGEHLGLYLARTLFRGSDFSMDTAEKKADLALFAGNVELSGITEDLFFTDPFHEHPRNRHTAGLATDAAAIRDDRDLKLASMALKAKFCGNLQTLLHGDLHTGSIMVTETDSRVIDAEFAVYGPMGFDIGSLLGNFWLAYFALSAQEGNSGDISRYGTWILDLAVTIWETFCVEFSRLWRHERAGILGGRELFEQQGDAIGPELAIQERLKEIWQDTLGFAGIEMHRRILGLAHIPEFETISDETLRADGERKALALGRTLAVHRERLLNVQAVNAIAATIGRRRQ